MKKRKRPIHANDVRAGRRGAAILADMGTSVIGASQLAGADVGTFATQKARASWTLKRRCKRVGREFTKFRGFNSPMRPRHGLWKGVST